MPDIAYQSALIVGAGSGLSASLARAIMQAGMNVSLAARSAAKLDEFVQATGAKAFNCDAAKRDEVQKLFADLDALKLTPDVVVYNASYRTRGPLAELDPVDVAKAIEITAYGGFLVGQAAAKRMLPKKHGAILFTGASASVKGYAQSAPFAMGKFALRGLAQSMARELSPQGIHVAHVVIDGGIKSARRPADPHKPDALLDPDAIAASYLHLLQQPRSAWTQELELRPWVEKF
ncbi:MAG TPA: SDR family NAD(P)-dependent oxidoreductase [Pseudolabrys sp.]|nr:SDR family NAD(P)-dependent oxidoreductase [Pseudolabrys sp.]